MSNSVILGKDMETYTRHDFEHSCIMLLGNEDYTSYTKQGSYNIPDMCNVVARKMLLDELKCTDRNILRVVQVTAYNLWRKDGCHGLT
jgi:hypothetical protein